MSFTPYDWNQSIVTRTEYVEARLREGSPVVGLSITDGILIVSIHRAHRKIFEIYDRLAFSGIGNQADVEMMRNAAIDFAHREGYQRSPDDVTASRLVGSVLSPALKRAFGDPFTAPFVFRGLFAELGGGLESDLFYSLGFDGEFRLAQRCCVVAGGEAETERAAERLAAGWREGMGLQEGLQLALRGWAAARRAPAADDGSGEAGPEEDVEAVLVRELEAGVLEAGLLERETPRESRFRLLAARELEPVRSELAAAR